MRWEHHAALVTLTVAFMSCHVMFVMSSHAFARACEPTARSCTSHTRGRGAKEPTTAAA